MLHVLLQCTQKVSPWGWSWSCNKWSVTVGQKEVTTQFQSFTTAGTVRLAIAIYINLPYIISKATPVIDRLPGWLPLPFRFNMLQWYSDHSGCPYSLGVLQARHLSMQATVKASPFGIGVWDATIDVTWVPGCLQVVQMLPWQFSVFMLLSRGTIW